MRIWVLLVLFPFLGCAPAATACAVQWRDPATLQDEAEVVVLGKVLSKSTSPPSFRGQDYAYRIEVLQLERGAFADRVMHIAFEDLRMHRRGDRVVCPIKNGSGIEHALEAGRRYRFFLGSMSPPTLSIALPID